MPNPQLTDRAGRRTTAAAWILAAACACGPSIDIVDLIEQSRTQDRVIAFRARETLDRYVLERRVDLFRAALDAERPENRGYALWSLGRIGTPEAMEVVVGQLDPARAFPLAYDLIRGHPTRQPADSRLQIARMLHRIGTPPGAVERAAAALDATEPIERHTGVQILGLLRDATATPLLVPMLHDSDPGVESAAAEALGSLGDPDAVGPLIERAVDPDAASRSSALTALRWFDDPSMLETLLAAHRTEPDARMRYKMVYLLGRFEDSRVIGALIPELESDDSNLRLVADNRLCELTHRRPGLSADDWRDWWGRAAAGYQFPP